MKARSRIGGGRQVGFAKKENAEWVYGKHAVQAVLQNPKRCILRLLIQESCSYFPKKEDWNQLQIQPEENVDSRVFAEILGKNAVHQGCAVLTRKLEYPSIEELVQDDSDCRPIVYLDQLSDPQNIGSILRAAAVFGGRALVTTIHNSSTLTTAAMKAASGATELVPLIHVVNLVNSINQLKKHGFWCVGLDEKAPCKIHEMSLNRKFILVVGSEGSGLRRLTRKSCDFFVQLPSFGDFTTLNAAQAVTVALYEILRQTQKVND
ncbi:MAG: 23S rRNA (guanosine(2251)-2'-O)-methyltransferase RlmB [Holosporaceae bacterium]|jgi:23S rRNA (guanosine2251-2'-O)-methyltransferase|nr:23S rRNA (guanosine(2251)-2'-O)-methyltransferase RlmB [Holosporaceae bacterium]